MTLIPGGLTPEQRNEAASALDRSFLAGFRLIMFACTACAWIGPLAVIVLLRKPGDGQTTSV
jgi:hypothetical protein